MFAIDAHGFDEVRSVSILGILDESVSVVTSRPQLFPNFVSERMFVVDGRKAPAGCRASTAYGNQYGTPYGTPLGTLTMR